MEYFHLTWVTHNSRRGIRMRNLGINLFGPPVVLSLDEEAKITGYIAEIVKEDQLTVCAYNICKDHMHMVLKCEERELTNIVQKLKSINSRRFGQEKAFRQGVMTPCLKTISKVPMIITPCLKSFSKSKNRLWAQKFNRVPLDTETKFYNAIYYVETNRIKLSSA